ncbi:isoleucine--tRNA ligase [Spiroplasma cantharicola]|uniref:Isoleucine--tRNA ligase n=1 Tax=Spiroplasma cantharicola TaxID=362837 RepID=A0A0M3SJF6_9MOLU|nr:isoleucine--tRNA ligase [Spiroplasma cantharicola]ALD66668.1 isoleucyl-tRNA synthetase [Spiroplasma cantharicola]
MEKNYKDTLLINQTSFDMKADLKVKEPRLQKDWLDKKIYQKKMQINKQKPSFVLHDGPPYANGNIHVGHALNKILKDIIVRWKNQSGYYSPYIMGWDTHGLPIETAITKTGIDRKALKPVEFRNLCKEYALNQVKNQSEQFRRLGIFTDYDCKYITLTDDFELSELKLFAKMVEKNLVYRDLKPIYWSPSSESALAEAEIEYAEIKSPTIFVACKIIDNKKFENTNFVIWTTTPWTIPSNQLIALGEDLEYVLVKPENDNRKFIIAKDLIDSVSEQIGWEKVKVLEIFKGSDLLKINYQHPWFENKTGFTVLGHHVTSEAGTGLVHIAGGFGEDDFEIVTKNKIKAFAPIDNQGKFDVTINDSRLEGIFYEDANKIIGTTLQEKNLLLKLKFVKHSYPHDWRTKKPVIYRATHQWFVSLESVKKSIDKVIVKDVQTNPEWSKERLRNIIKDRNDWTISRQRLWGVPIIAFFDKNKQPQLTNEIVEYAIGIIEKKGTNAWFDLPADTFLPDKFKGLGWEKETDILDVWFDSGSSNLAMEQNFNLKRPFDVYLEGNDQYRGWFNSSMINSVIYDGKPAYKQLITHGMTNDEKGKKMSKSIGNTIDPLEIANDLGADILRLWVFSTDFTDDQRIGKDILKQVSESYRKIRNTIRFILSNLVDFNPKKDYQKNLEDVDKFALNNLSVTKNKFYKAMETYSFNSGFKLINNYVTNDLSSFYLDFIKDIIYVEAANSKRRRQVQTVIYEQLWALLDMLKPILIHTVEEAYQNIENLKKEDSIHLLDLKEQNFLQKEDFISKWNTVLNLRDDVNEALEKARNEKIIKKGFEAVINLEIPKEFSFIKEIKDLNQILIVNSINFSDLKGKINSKVANVSVELKQGLKCQRCWAIFDQLNEDICQRCFNVIN